MLVQESLRRQKAEKQKCRKKDKQTQKKKRKTNFTCRLEHSGFMDKSVSPKVTDRPFYSCLPSDLAFERAPVPHLVVYRAITWQVVSLRLTGTTLRVFKTTEEKVLPL